MAIRRFIPIQDCFIAEGLEKNTGLDEILTLGKCTDNITGSSRILLQFTTAAMLSSSGFPGYTASIHLSCCNASSLPVSYSIACQRLEEEWDEGTGKLSDINQLVDGATWVIKNRAGAAWAVAGGTLDSSSAYTSSFVKGDTKDLTISLGQDTANASGYILSCPELSNSQLNFYGSDTHTIYKPYLEIKWKDAVYSPETDSVVVDSDFINVVVSNLKKEYALSDYVKLNLSVRPQYPTRVYTTDSIYRDSYVLPSSSYWGIKNEFTNEMVVDFDAVGTAISADSEGNYFQLNMDLLEPERYYRLLIQVVGKDSSKTIIDGRNIFKVVRNGRN